MPFHPHQQPSPVSPLPRTRLTTAATKQIARVQERFIWMMHLLDAGGRKFVVLGLGSWPPPPQEEEEVDEGAVGAAITLERRGLKTKTKARCHGYYFTSAVHSHSLRGGREKVYRQLCAKHLEAILL